MPSSGGFMSRATGGTISSPRPICGNADADQRRAEAARDRSTTIALLAELSARLAKDPAAPPQVRERVTRMHEFIATLANWYEQVRGLPKPTLVTLMKLGGRIARFVSPRASKTSH